MPLKIKPRNGVYYLIGSIDGQRIRKSLGTSDKKAAAEAAAQYEAKARRQALYGLEAETTFADAYLLYNRLGRNDRGHLAPIVKAIGKHSLRSVTPAKVKDLAKRLYPNLRPQTWNRYVIVPVSAVINHAHQHGLCPPIRIARFAAEDVRERTAVTREWIDRFRAGALELYGGQHSHLGERLAAYALFMFTTAARPTEATQLTPEQLNLPEHIGESRYPIRKGKGKHERRKFYLTEEVATELASLEPREIGWGRSKGELRVFGWADKLGPLPTWKAVCKHAGLAYRSPYEAGRHSFATEAVTRQERNVKVSAAVGGWKDASVMLKHYAKVEGANEFAEEVFGKTKQHKKK